MERLYIWRAGVHSVGKFFLSFSTVLQRRAVSYSRPLRISYCYHSRTKTSNLSLLTARPERDMYSAWRQRVRRYVYSALKGRADGRGRGRSGATARRPCNIPTKTHADALNELLAGCIARGRCTRKEAKPEKSGWAWYFRLYGADLEELGGQLYRLK